MGEQEKENSEIEIPPELKADAQEKEGEIRQIASPDKDLGEQAPISSVVQMEADIKRLAESLEQKAKEAEANQNKFLRACADLENYKKRADKEKSELINFSNEKLIKELIPVADNLERAIDHIEDESDLAAIKDGIKLVRDSLLAVLKKFGVEAASAIGEKFDPTRHEAVSQEEASECEHGTVIREFHKCYYLNGRLIRPAMVVISKTPAAAPSAKGGADEMEYEQEGED